MANLPRREHLVVDGHTDVPTRLLESPAPLGERRTDRHVDLPRLREGGVGGLVFALYIPKELSPEQGWEHALKLHRISVEHIRAVAPSSPDLEVAVSAEDVRRAWSRGVVSVIFGLENGRPLADFRGPGPLGQPEVSGKLDELVKMGVRYITLTHMASHEWCDASTGERLHGGLSAQGERIVWEMVRRGIVPDVSHVSDEAVLHTLDVAKIPIVASHSSARALCDHPRNLPDPLIREIARKGGVVMANSFPAFVSEAASRAERERSQRIDSELSESGEEPHGPEWERLRDRLYAESPLPKVPLSVFVDHILHLLEVAGEEHVGVGSDFDGIPDVIEGFEDVSKFPDLTAALRERGVEKGALGLVLGANFLRVLEKAEG
jgi:membrane dipeptidase